MSGSATTETAPTRIRILHADYSDPHVVRVGDDFYLTASSFNAIPGLPILHSKDLVNWEMLAYALKEQPPPGANPKQREQYSRQLTAQEAEQFSPDRYLTGSDGWKPRTVK
jgi:beta-xylosidase